MKIALVDDEKLYADKIDDICRGFFGKNGAEAEIYAFSDGESFLGSLNERGYDIVFMDIFMNGMDGVSAAKKLREIDGACLLIFLTSCGERMPEAFSCHAFEYIIKPFTPERVGNVLRDALALLPKQNYVEIYSERRTVRVPFENIVSVMSDAHYLDIAIANGTGLRSRMTMPQFMEQTNGDARFIPINKGITVNADYIIDFENNCCILENSARLPIRIRDRLKIEQAARDYNFAKIRGVQRSGKG